MENCVRRFGETDFGFFKEGEFDVLVALRLLKMESTWKMPTL